LNLIIAPTDSSIVTLLYPNKVVSGTINIILFL
jgi:hypothetical protein